MAKFKVFFTTEVEQRVEVYAEDEFEAEDMAYEELKSVPFIGWEFSSSGSWEHSGTDLIED